MLEWLHKRLGNVSNRLRGLRIRRMVWRRLGGQMHGVVEKLGVALGEVGYTEGMCMA